MDIELTGVFFAGADVSESEMDDRISVVEAGWLKGIDCRYPEKYAPFKIRSYWHSEDDGWCASSESTLLIDKILLQRSFDQHWRVSKELYKEVHATVLNTLLNSNGKMIPELYINSGTAR